MAKIKKITDVKVIVELRGLSYIGNEQDEIKKKGQQAKDFMEFLKDHRSADVFNARIQNDTIEVCEHCGYEWEWDNDPEGPNCCQKALEEFEKTKLITV